VPPKKFSSQECFSGAEFVTFIVWGDLADIGGQNMLYCGKE